MKIRKHPGKFLLASLIALHSYSSLGGVIKTMSVDHGQAIICRSQGSALVVEFEVEPRESALVEHVYKVRDHVRARYRYKLYNYASGTLTEGSGKVNEITETVAPISDSEMEVSIRGKTQIVIGEFHIEWSPQTPGATSWLYYTTKSPIIFIQQNDLLAFEDIDAGILDGYRTAKNITVVSNKTSSVTVIGPSAFSSISPDQLEGFASIEACEIVDGRIEFELVDLQLHNTYLIERSYTLDNQQWEKVQTITPNNRSSMFSEQLRENESVGFYRIRQIQ